MTLRQLDFRNGKYQGYAHNNQPNGFGMILDDHYNLIIGNWEKAKPHGPTLIIYDDSSMIYGHFQHNQPTSMFIYEGENIIIYSHQQTLVVEEPSSKLLMLIQQQEKSKIVKKTTYKSKQDKFSRIMEMLKVNGQFPTQFESYRQFVRENFKTQHSELLQIYDNNRQYMLSYRNETIFIKLCKISRKILAIGYRTNKNKNILEIGRKYTYTYNDSIIIEEAIYTYPQSHIQYQYPDRFVECIRNLHEYYRKSLTFVNGFVNFRYLFQFKQKFSKIQHIIKQSIGQEAQLTIQESPQRFKLDHQPTEPQHSNTDVTIYDLKREVERAKSKNKSKISTINQSFIRSKDNYDTGNKQESRRQVTPKNMKVQRNYKEEVSYSPSVRSSRHTTDRARIKRITILNEKGSNKVQKRTPKKYRLEQSRSSSQRRGEKQNLEKLTQNYKLIQNQLRSTTPQKLRKRSPYRTKFNYLEDVSLQKRTFFN